MSRINNSFRLTGHLGADPETRFLPTTGAPVARLSLAANHVYRDKKTDEKVERTDWFDLTVYSRGLVDVAQQYVRKGSQIQVRGHMLPCSRHGGPDWIPQNCSTYGGCFYAVSNHQSFGLIRNCYTIHP